jgi:hypothetical protein
MMQSSILIAGSSAATEVNRIETVPLEGMVKLTVVGT